MFLRGSRSDFYSNTTPLHCPVHYMVHFEGKDAEAQSLYERCQEIQEKALGPEHPSLAITLNNRVLLTPVALTTPLLCFPLTLQGKYPEADRLFLRAIEIWEKALGPEHPNVALPLNNRAMLLTKKVRAQEMLLEIS